MAIDKRLGLIVGASVSLGFLLGGAVFNRGDQIAKLQLESRLSSSSYEQKLSALKLENERAWSHVTIVERVLPDGSKERRVESHKESERISDIKIVENKTAAASSASKSKIETQSRGPKLLLDIGFSSKLRAQAAVSYVFSSPVYVRAEYSQNLKQKDPEFLLGVGFYF